MDGTAQRDGATAAAMDRLRKRSATPASSQTSDEFVAELRQRREELSSGGSGSGESSCGEPPIARQRTNGPTTERMGASGATPPHARKLSEVGVVLCGFAESVGKKDLVDPSSDDSFGALLASRRTAEMGGPILGGLLTGSGSVHPTICTFPQSRGDPQVVVTVPVAGTSDGGSMYITRMDDSKCVQIQILSASGLQKHMSSGELKKNVLDKLAAVYTLFAPPELCSVCRAKLPTPFQPFENGMPPVCRGGDCEARMREDFEQTAQRPQSNKPGLGAKEAEAATTRTIATLLAQKGSAARRRAAPQQAEVLCYAPEDEGVHPGRMPSLLEPFRVRDSNGAFHTVQPMECISIEKLIVWAFACGAGKSFRIFEAINHILKTNPRRPVLSVSAKRVHAGDLFQSLESLGFLVYLENESAAGMAKRISDHVREQADKGLGPRVVCNITSVRALPKSFMDMFESQHGVLIFDEARSTVSYIREYSPREQATFSEPDPSLDRLVNLARSSTVVVSDADALCDGATLALARRVAPQKTIRCICSQTHWLDLAVEIAFGGLADKSAGKDEDKNEGRKSILHRFFAAVRRARGNVEERVYVQCASKSQIEALKRMLMERGLWDQTRCKTYQGASPDKADLVNTTEAWSSVYLVIVNGAVTVAINIEVRFGAAFMLTDNAPGVALVRDGDQGIVRIWRKPELEPPEGAMGRGPDGRCRIFALLGCATPKSVAPSLDAVKKGAVVSPVDFQAWLQKQHANALRALTQDASEGQAKHGGKGSKVSPGTAEIMAWNVVERKASTSQHVAEFLHLSSLSTRGWHVRCIEAFADHDPTHQPLQNVQTEEGSDGEEESGGEKYDDEFDVDAADEAILKCCTQDDAVYKWFVSTFIAFFTTRYEFWKVTHAFFSTAQGEYKRFFETLTKRAPSSTGNGRMEGALKGIFKALYPIQRIVALPAATEKKLTPYAFLKGKEVMLRRRASLRLFSPEELRARPVPAQHGVQMSDLTILLVLKRAAYALQLDISDLLGFQPGEGGFSLSGDDMPLVPVEMGCVPTPLDFTPRSPAGPGQQPADLRCGGRWGFAGDVHERFKEEDCPKAMKAAWKGLQDAASSLKVSTHNAQPLSLLGSMLMETVGIQLKLERCKGTTVRGTETKHKLKGISIVQKAEGFSQRIQFKLATEPGDTEWSAAFKFKAEQAVVDARSSTGADGPHVIDTDATWQQGNVSAGAALHTLVAEHEQEWQHMLPLDLQAASLALEVLRSCNNAVTWEKHRSALESAIANCLGSGGNHFVPLTTLREPEGCGPRRYGSPFDPLDVPTLALSVMLCPGKHDRLRVCDEKIKGALPLRLLHKHVHLQRQYLSGSSSAVPEGPPAADLVRAAEERVKELTAMVVGGDTTPESLRNLIAAKEEVQKAVDAQQSSLSTSGGSSAVDGVLPSTTKLQALLRSDDDCTELSRSVMGKFSDGVRLSREHEDVRNEAHAVVDALIAKGDSWQAKLREKLNNRKAGELKKLSGHEKWAKEHQLKRWARKVFLERLLDDAALLVEAYLAKLNGGNQYVQFVDASSCTDLLLYVPSEPDLGLARDDPDLVGTTQLASIGASVTLQVDNDGLRETADDYRRYTQWTT